MRLPRGRAGFTLIEVSVMILIITILVAVAVPHFADSIKTSNEGYTRANLGAIRKALSVYYSEVDGQYPQTLPALTTGARYLRRVPTARVPPHHADSDAVLDGSTPDDSGGWYYNGTPSTAGYGVARVNCTHTDARGSVWTSY